MDESKIETMHVAGDYDKATTALLELYGREVFGFMRSRLRNEDWATEAYSAFAVDVWKGMAGFRRQCPFRPWAYAIARNAMNRAAVRGARPMRQEVAWNEEVPPALAKLVRTATADYLRTEIKSRFAELRNKLSEDDRTILLLRVDKRMEWRDVATVFLGPDASEAELHREAARLRQSFSYLKEKLKTLARDEGLIKDDD